MLRALLWLCLLVWTSVPAQAAGPDRLADGGVARVVSVTDGDTVVLDDGRQVRFVGIQAPKLPLGRPNFEPWPMGEEAKAALQDMAQGQGVRLRLGANPEDRHGRVLAHLVTAPGGVWLQGEMLSRGLARVYTFPDNRILAAEMLRRERLARAEKRGIWALPFYALRDADTVRFDEGTFQIVEDRVVDAAQVKKWIYLNFGPDWRTDFTVKIATRHAPLFAEAGIDLLALKGQRVRVRGWVRNQNGPMIELDHPERLEVLAR